MLSTIEVIFNKQGNKLAQQNPQFRNKDPEFAHPIKIEISKNNISEIGKYVGLAKQINYVTSYGEDEATRNHEYKAIKLLCKIIISVNKTMAGFDKIYNKADVINSNIPTIYNEIIPNAQKAICENLMKDAGIRNTVTDKIRESHLLNLLKEKGLNNEKIKLIKENRSQLRALLLKYKKQIEVLDPDWYSDMAARRELIREAQKKQMKIFFYFSYRPYHFEFGAKNKAYVDPRILKELNTRLKEPIKEGVDFINAFKASESRIGAGLGLDLTKICINNIEEECNVTATAKYENDDSGMLIMSIDLSLGLAKPDKPNPISL